MAEQVVHLICAECGRFSEDYAEGSRTYTAGGVKAVRLAIAGTVRVF
jgi:hypothetical protein